MLERSDGAAKGEPIEGHGPVARPESAPASGGHLVHVRVDPDSGEVAVLVPATPGEREPFPSYWHAFLDLFRSLADPRVGAQWHVANAGGTRKLARAA